MAQCALLVSYLLNNECILSLSLCKLFAFDLMQPSLSSLFEDFCNLLHLLFVLVLQLFFIMTLNLVGQFYLRGSKMFRRLFE